jgi:hypothetical protein
MRKHEKLCAAVVVVLVLAGARLGASEEAEFYLVWGPEGKWDGSLEAAGATFLKAEPFSFEEQYGDAFQGADEHRVAWRSGTGGQVDGIHVVASLAPGCRLELQTLSGRRELTWSDFPPRGQENRVIRLGPNRLLVIGQGDPNEGPRLPRGLPLPPLYQAPRPVDPTALTEADPAEPLLVRLSQAPPGELAVRRGSCGDGRLYLELYSPAGPLAGEAEVHYGSQKATAHPRSGSLWFSRPPRIGAMLVEIQWPVSGEEKEARASLAGSTPRAAGPDGAGLPFPGGIARASLLAPTTLVEVCGPRLFLNGEPLLIKGSLPRDLDDAGAAYLKSLGANTIRSNKIEYLDKYGFLGIVPVNPWSPRFCERAKTDKEFLETLEKDLAKHLAAYRAALANPRLLVLQYANEQVMGQDRWSGRLGRRSFDRLDYLLARCHNAFKPVDPMLPHGYSNCAFGYRAPDFLDVYLHNTYLDKDRGWPPLAEFMKFQGCDRRPYIHTEFGANVYMPQVYLGGPNTPVMEKLHAWNYRHRWHEYLRAGAQGGTNYCFYDYDYAKINVHSWDKGFTNFGVMTFDRKPKLACWELWHLWRDFEIEPQTGPSGGTSLAIRYARDYWARDCRLTLETKAGRQVLPLEDFPPHGRRSADVPGITGGCRWRMDYTTHRGLSMVACGAFPVALEAEDFLARLADRPTAPFLRELFDAEVLTADGRGDATALKDLERFDGVVTVVFRKPNGVIYVAALARRSKAPYFGPTDLELAFTGRVIAVDEMTGQPSGSRVETEPLAGGLRIKNVKVPYVPDRYGERSQTPLCMPVFRIEPARQ